MKFSRIVLHSSMRAIGSLPLGLRQLLGRSLGSIFSYIPTPDRTIARLQLERFCPGTPATTIRRMYGNLGQVVLEAFNLQPILNNHIELIEYSGRDTQLPELIARGRPLIALTAHLGNWDLLAGYMAKLGVPLTVIGRQARNEDLQTVLVELREAYGVQMIWRTSGSQGLKAIMRALESKRTVAALIDQDTRVSSIPVSFFGQPVMVPAGLVELGKKYNAIFTAAFVTRTSKNTFKVHVYEIDGSLSTAEILAQYNHYLEQLIQKHPEQWVWLHKRWRTLADGKRLSSRQYIQYLRNAEGANSL